MQVIDSRYEKEKTSWEDFCVSYDALQQYIQIIDETNTFYMCSSTAKQAGFPDIPLPVTYIALFWHTFSIPWLKDQVSTVLTTQSFDYQAPLFINQPYRAQITLDKLRCHHDKQWASHILHVYNQGMVVATMKTTLVLTTGE